jgi:hypothetical protein
MLIKFVRNKHDQWDEFLDTCAFAYNTSVQESTLFSPFELMFGRKATLPIDLDMSKDNVDEKIKKLLENGEEKLITSEVERLTNRRIIVEEAKLNIKKAQEKQKEAFAKKACSTREFQSWRQGVKKGFSAKE